MLFSNVLLNCPAHEQSLTVLHRRSPCKSRIATQTQAESLLACSLYINLLRPGRTFHRGSAVLQEREGAPDEPVIMNPFRHNVSATYRSIDDFPDLAVEENPIEE